jgi:predicted DNA-binding protein YlxM (UPF0122 family)
MPVERFVFINLLYDFYGQMLTERQRQAIELYFQLDLSLSEIGAELGVSRQAVHDLLKRSEEALLHYEQRLGLVERWSDQQTKIKELRQLLEALADEQEQRWQQVFALLGELTQ